MTDKPKFKVGDFVLVPHSETFSRPGRIEQAFMANYASKGMHWRYIVRYVKPNLSDYKSQFLKLASIGEDGLEEMNPMDALARVMPKRRSDHLAHKVSQERWSDCEGQSH